MSFKAKIKSLFSGFGDDYVEDREQRSGEGVFVPHSEAYKTVRAMAKKHAENEDTLDDIVAPINGRPKKDGSMGIIHEDFL